MQITLLGVRYHDLTLLLLGLLSGFSPCFHICNGNLLTVFLLLVEQLKGKKNPQMLAFLDGPNLIKTTLHD